MNEIKCPHCGKVFSVDESEYALLLSQVKNVEFHKELEEREKNLKENQKNIIDLEKSKLVNSYLPNNGYASIVDRFVIENFYNYKNIEGLNDSYVDYRSKSFNERFNLVQDYTQQFGSNLARLTILYNDLNNNLRR